jgi:uncharacterized cupin superfamily protein
VKAATQARADDRLTALLWTKDGGTKREATRDQTWALQHANEELAIVLSGTPTLRTPEGERQLVEDEVVVSPAGRQGAHQIFNQTEEPVRYLMVSTMNAPDVVEYPDEGKLDVISRSPGSLGDEDELAAWFRLEDQVSYWD